MNANVAYQPVHTSANDLPLRLALLPDDIRQENGLFRMRGMTTGRLLRHRSALLVGMVADFEWNRGLRDVVSVDDVLAHGGPAWSEEILERIDGDLAPHLLVRVSAGGDDRIQAVTACTEREKAGCLLKGSMQATRDAYRAHGLAWGVVTDAHLDFHRVSNALWISRAVEQGAPLAALHAVRSALTSAGRRESIAEVLGRAAEVAGVPIDSAGTAFGCLIASRQVAIGIDDGVIRSDRAPGSGGERADDVTAAWLRDMRPVPLAWLGASLSVDRTRSAVSAHVRSRRHLRVGYERHDPRPWSRTDRRG